MITISSSQAQNTFGEVIDRSQREVVSVTRRGRVTTLIMSPEVLEDLIEGALATEAKNRGLHSAEKSKSILDKYR